MTDEMTSKQNKVKINASVSRKIKNEYDKRASIVDEEGNLIYSGKSNLIETALIYFLGAQDKENELKTKQLEEELNSLKRTYDLQLKEAEEKIKKLEAEVKRNKDLFIKLLINHPELHAELFPELQQDDSDKPKTRTRYVEIE